MANAKDVQGMDAAINRAGEELLRGAAEIIELKQQNRELVEACGRMLPFMRNRESITPGTIALRAKIAEQARAVLAKARKEG